MLSVEEARQQMLNTIPVLPTEKREILSCTDYVLAEALACRRKYSTVRQFSNGWVCGSRGGRSKRFRR